MEKIKGLINRIICRLFSCDWYFSYPKEEHIIVMFCYRCDKKRFFVHGSEVNFCPKCNGTGWYQYDHNHSKICEFCCKHDHGFFRLKKYYGKDNGKLCCKKGCGFTK